MPKGGKRPGAGLPKGYKFKSTLDKIAAREFVRQAVTANLAPLVHAQLSNAIGIKYLVVREKSSGKFLRVGAGRAEKLNPDEEVIEIWEKDPSVQAFTDLLNRALDKPTEHVEMQVSGELDLVARRLDLARKRRLEALAPAALPPVVTVENPQ